MFLVKAMDNNNEIILIAFGIGKTESREPWIWFYRDWKNVIRICTFWLSYPIGPISLKRSFRLCSQTHMTESVFRHLLMNMLANISKQDITKKSYRRHTKLTDILILKKGWLGYDVLYLMIYVHRLAELVTINVIFRWLCIVNFNPKYED